MELKVLSPLAPTPDQPPTIRRSFTTPTRLDRTPRTISTAREVAEEVTETLYAHNAAKIVSFNPPRTGTRRHSSVEQGHSALEDEPVGTLPWVSPTERTIAAGPLRIYRVRGSILFLQSGATLKPIFAKSQCWCVDGESKFVLPLGPHTFYRIELPDASLEDHAKVEEFKGMLAKVLQYETTPCPFKRGFTVNLPEKPKTSAPKKPWKPQERLHPAATTERSTTTEWQHRIWRKPPLLADHTSVAEWQFKPEVEEPLDDFTDSVREDSAGSSELSQDSEATDDSNSITRHPTLHARQAIDSYKTPTRPRTLKTGRAITAPPQLSLRTTPTLGATGKDLQQLDTLDETDSLSSSVDSFHSFHSPISPLPPSPRFPQLSSLPHSDEIDGISMLKIRTHRRDDSELTVTADSQSIADQPESLAVDRTAEPSSPDLPRTPPLVSDSTSQSEEQSPEIITPSAIPLRRRPRKSRRRSQSPLPSPANLYSPTSRLSGHHLTTAILQKTCSMLLGPPVSLVALMLNIASRIMNGTYDGFTLGYAGSSQNIPCSWDFSDTDQATDSEDDYGFALDKLPSSRSSSRCKDLAGSWEID
ncbi:MAG: hypothetical protein Q9182_002536 [Xanthomendoza sp. 2 TL-2023]